MRVLYEPVKKHLIIAPLRCGSSILEDNAEKYNLVVMTSEIPHNYGHESELYNNTEFLNLIKESDKRTFLFKEPFERLVSFYRTFVYYPHFFKHDGELNKRFRLFFSENRKQDFWDDMLQAWDLIEQHYKYDPHTTPQYHFFKSCNQNVDDYEIVSTDEYRKWICLNFAEKIEDRISPIHEIPIKFSSISKIQKLHEMCKILYKEDYEYLEPKVTYF